MRRILLIGSILFLSACSVEPGSEKWCLLKADQPKTDWTGSDAITYARNCLIEGSALGSTGWCKDLSNKPKGDWTSNDMTGYARYCIM
jgi:hypothetical protein